jgi:hypothetical protein
MLRTGRVAAVAALAASMLSTAAPPAGAVGPCQVRASGVGTGFTQTYLVTGEHAPAGAIDVQLTCGVVKNGFTVARFTDDLSGPVALVAGTVNLSSGQVYACYESRVHYADGRSSYYDGCP